MRKQHARDGVRLRSVAPRAASSRGFSLDNRSGYDSGDLRAFFTKAFRSLGVRRFKRVIIVASPIRTRGCAEVARDRSGSKLVIAIAPPSKFTPQKFARIVQHEIAHARGLEHAAMPEPLLYSEGGVPGWARGLRVRYRGRAPDQIRFLGRGA